MDTEKAFDGIMEDIKNERFEMVRPQIDSILALTDDVMIRLKCASLLKTIDPTLEFTDVHRRQLGDILVG